MKTKRIALILMLILSVLLFAACGDETEEVEASLPPENASAAVESDIGEPVGQEPETTGTKLNADELKALDKMLFGKKSGENWYLRSIAVQWPDADPNNIDISVLFYNGFDGECQNFTDEEIFSISMATGMNENDLRAAGQFRLPEAKMDYVLREYYGTTFTDFHGIGLEKMIYLPETACYYMLHDDMTTPDFGLHSAYEQPEGGFIIYYGADAQRPAPEYVMELAPNEFGSYTILYNKSVQN